MESRRYTGGRNHSGGSSSHHRRHDDYDGGSGDTSSAFLIERALRGEPLTQAEMNQQEHILQQAKERSIRMSNTTSSHRNSNNNNNHDNHHNGHTDGGGGGNSNSVVSSSSRRKREQRHHHDGTNGYNHHTHSSNNNRIDSSNNSGDDDGSSNGGGVVGNHNDDTYSTSDQSGGPPSSDAGSSNIQSDLAKKETRWINRSKILVAIVLLCATAITGRYTYRLTYREETEDFEYQFREYGNELLESSVITANNVFGTIESISTSITSYAISSNSKFPFVTIPHYTQRVQHLLKLSGSYYLGYSPLVVEDQRVAWENYTIYNQNWMIRDNANSNSNGNGNEALPEEEEEEQEPVTVITEEFANSTTTTNETLSAEATTATASSTATATTDATNEWLNSLSSEMSSSSPAGSESLLITPYIFKGNMNSPIREDRTPNPYYAPFWQVTPIVAKQINYNLFDINEFSTLVDTIFETHLPVLSNAQWVVKPNGQLNELYWPQSFLAAPIFDTFLYDNDDVDNESENVDVDTVKEEEEDTRNVVAIFSAVIPWHSYFTNVIPEESFIGGIYAVISNTCNQQFTYLVEGPNVTYLGPGDLHDTKFTSLGISSEFNKFSVTSDDDETTSQESNSRGATKQKTCAYTMSMYPTSEFRDEFDEGVPFFYTLFVVLIFLATSLVFVLYDCLVQHRQSKVVKAAARSAALVSTLFPAQVRDRLMDDAMLRRGLSATNNLLKSAIGQGGGNGLGGEGTGSTLTMEKEQLLKSKPIADLFPECTVMFADIAGFTAWSSVREPAQVFTLLEQIYGSFDALAKRRGVFKVETIGDCYVAVSGLPHPRADHAIVMCRFARDCMNEMNETVDKLEVLLGPDTSELEMRFGLHSGPVTAGVLRGEKSRFQLFGDTVNTAARMEENGIRNRIHVSQETANLLIVAGKKNWIKSREELVAIKGKGEMQTYWVELESSGGHGARRVVVESLGGNNADKFSISEINNVSTGEQTGSDKDLESVGGNVTIGGGTWAGGTVAGTSLGGSHLSVKSQRLIEWNVDVLQRLLKKIVAMRPRRVGRAAQGNFKISTTPGATVLDEVQEIITLPGKAAKYKQDPLLVQLDPKVVTQLRNYVATIASLYRDNHFHSFDHASHVTQSVTKLLARVVTPESIDYKDMKYKKQQGETQLHEYTYGITSDPLTQFACAFSALIHDVDHTGVPNTQLIKEDADLALLYRNQSVAEQNSVDIAWELLNRHEFKLLRECIYSTQEELSRFRQLVVNSVMATDIVDKELGALRKKRWETAFSANSTVSTPDSERDDVNRKATIVIEHLIQASDVSHTMQHWHVYCKWNKKFFNECYKAYLDGRADKDPSIGWYQGELGFFDFYIIPLAKKLKECGCFGVSSDEYLNYAMANRKEWEIKGKEVVTQYLEDYKI